MLKNERLPDLCECRGAPSRVLITSEVRFMQEGLGAIFGHCGAISVVGYCANVDQSSKLCRELRPDMVLVDAAVRDGPLAVRRLRETSADLQGVVFAVDEAVDLVLVRVEAGAAGLGGSIAQRRHRFGIPVSGERHENAHDRIGGGPRPPRNMARRRQRKIHRTRTPKSANAKPASNRQSVSAACNRKPGPEVSIVRSADSPLAIDPSTMTRRVASRSMPSAADQPPIAAATAWKCSFAEVATVSGEEVSIHARKTSVWVSPQSLSRVRSTTCVPLGVVACVSISTRR